MILRLKHFQLFVAILLCGTVGLAGDPVLAKKKVTSETYTVQKKTVQKNKAKSASDKDCRPGPVPPFMRNPRFMNRGFLKNRC